MPWHYRIRTHIAIGVALFAAHAMGQAAPAPVALSDAAAKVAAGIVAHDSQVQDLTVLYTVEVRRIADSAVTPTFTGQLQIRGQKIHWKMDSRWPGGSVYTSEYTYDGQLVRVFSRAVDGTTMGAVRHKRERIGESIEDFRTISGRLLSGVRLIDLLERGEATVSPDQIEMDGKKCWVVQAGEYKLWLDASCGFMPRRLEQRYHDGHGQPTTQYYISNYELAEVRPGIWAPIRAKLTDSAINDDGSLTPSTTEKMIHHVVSVNTGFADDAFVLVFPVGTSVLDWGPQNDPAKGTRYVVGQD
jgi:hypothetical protein